MEALRLGSASTSGCCVHSSQPSLIGLNCHTMPCKRRIKVPHRTLVAEPVATVSDINCYVSRHVKYATVHWLTLIMLYFVLLFNVCNGLVVSKKFLNEDNTDNATDTEIVRERRALINLQPVPGPRWDNSTVPFVFEKGLPLRIQRQTVRAMCAWMKQTNCIKFVERTDEPYFINFQHSFTGECSSNVGRITARIYYPINEEPRGQPVFLTLSCNRGHIMHELGHALGFYHEHQRPDRDKYVSVLHENIISSRAYLFTKRTDVSSLGSLYDYGSIMHFGLYAYSTRRSTLKTLEPLLEYEGEIGQRKRLSTQDREQINDVYSCPVIDANKNMLPTDADIITNGNWITLSPLNIVKSYDKRLVCDHHNCTLSTCAGRLFKYHDVRECSDNLISIKKISGIPNDNIIRSGDSVSIRWEIANTKTLVPLHCTNESMCSLSEQCSKQESCAQHIFTIEAHGKSSFQPIEHSDQISLKQLSYTGVSNETVSVYALSCTENMTCATTLQCIVPTESVTHCNNVLFHLQKY